MFYWIGGSSLFLFFYFFTSSHQEASEKNRNLLRSRSINRQKSVESPVGVQFPTLSRWHHIVKTVERKKIQRGKNSSPVVFFQKKETGEFRTWPTFLSLGQTEEGNGGKTNCLLLFPNFSLLLLLFFLLCSLRLCVRVLVCVAPWGPAGGAVRTPCPALFSSG